MWAALVWRVIPQWESRLSEWIEGVKRNSEINEMGVSGREWTAGVMRNNDINEMSEWSQVD